MSYMSGMMMGMAFGKGVGQLLAGSAAPMLGQGVRRMMGGGMSQNNFSDLGDGIFNLFSGSRGKGQGRGQGRGKGQGQGQSYEGEAAPSEGLVLSRSITGRRRYYSPKLVNNKGLAEALESSLSKLSYLKEVKVNPVTGSLLLIYQCEEGKIDELVRQLSRRMFGGAAEGQAAAGESAAGGLAALGQGLKNFVGNINRQVKVISRGLLDLPSLLSLVFTIQGLEKILVSKQLPSGPQMLWWAFSLLRGWRIA